MIPGPSQHRHQPGPIAGGGHDLVLARVLLDELCRVARRPWAVMEVCGGQTHTIVRQGIDELLPAGIRMIHGPGCPVCVTPLETLDRAMAIAACPEVILASFGDMLRAPGSRTDLLALKVRGADVRVAHSPMDAVALAGQRPDKQVVFLAVGFETTASANAMAILRAAGLGLPNFSMLVSHVLVPRRWRPSWRRPAARRGASSRPGTCAR
jgi:hydrogenase expression/formation protein HypD